MTKLYSVLIVLLYASTLCGQTLTSEQAQVQQTIKNLFAALTEADTVAMKTFSSTNVRFYEYGEVWPMDTLISKAIKSKSISDFKRTNSFDFVSTTINNNTAWTTYYLQSTFFRNGKEEIVKWMETIVLIKDKNRWNVDVLHSTRLSKN